MTCQDVLSLITFGPGKLAHLNRDSTIVTVSKNEVVDSTDTLGRDFFDHLSHPTKVENHVLCTLGPPCMRYQGSSKMAFQREWLVRTLASAVRRGSWPCRRVHPTGSNHFYALLLYSLCLMHIVD